MAACNADRLYDVAGHRVFRSCGNRHACIVDGEAIITKDNRVVLYVWYGNEFGYACQVVRVVQKWQVFYPLIPNDVVSGL